MTFRFSQLVGRYRLVLSNDLRSFIERTFVDTAPQAEQARVRTEALLEAEGAELEILADGTFISRSGEQEFFRIVLPVDDREHEQLVFDKTPGNRVCLSRLDEDRLLTLQPGKPAAEFVRIA